MTNIQAIGVVRFSYLCEGGFQIAHDSLDARHDYLFQTARIEERFALFEHVTLPAIRKQTDPDFILIVLISQRMPDPYLERLATLLDGIPQIALVALEPMNMVDAAKLAVDRFKDKAADVVAHFRLDDDDAVGVDFIATLKADFEENKALFNEHERFALDYQRGYVLSHDQSSLMIEHVIQRLWGCALVLFFKPSAPGNALSFAHNLIDRHMPVVEDSKNLMFIRTLNRFNDSQRWISQLRMKHLCKSDEDQLLVRFNLNPSRLHRLSPD